MLNRITLYNSCSVHRGMLSTSGRYHEYTGGVQYIGGYHDACGGYHDACGGYHDACGGYHGYIRGCSVHWGDPSVHRGDIMSTLGMFSTSGDIMMHVGEQVGKNLSISVENPNVLTIQRRTHDIPPMYS